MIIQINNLKFKIRKCTSDDYQFCYRMSKNNMLFYVNKYWGGWNPKTYRDNFDKSNIKIIEYKNKRAGFYNLVFENSFAYLKDIQISKLLRNKGLGTYLLLLMEKETRKKGLNKIRLRVFKDNPSSNLYKRLGYKEVEDENTSIILEKKL